MPSLAYTEMDHEKIPRFIAVCIWMHYLDIITRINMYIIWLLILDNKIIGNENGIPLR